VRGPPLAQRNSASSSVDGVAIEAPNLAYLEIRHDPGCPELIKRQDRGQKRYKRRQRLNR
jgi:hypothetical protein